MMGLPTCSSTSETNPVEPPWSDRFLWQGEPTSCRLTSPRFFKFPFWIMTFCHSWCGDWWEMFVKRRVNTFNMPKLASGHLGCIMLLLLWYSFTIHAVARYNGIVRSFWLTAKSRPLSQAGSSNFSSRTRRRRLQQEVDASLPHFYFPKPWRHVETDPCRLLSHSCLWFVLVWALSIANRNVPRLV